MIKFLKRNRINFIVALIIAIPICILADAEQTERTPRIVIEEPTETIVTLEPIDTIVVGDPIETETTEEITYGVDHDDLELLAHLIYAEAGYSWMAEETLYYVGSVVLNRVNSDLYPDTIYDVIYQTEPCLQYACIVDGNIEKTPTDRCYRIAYDLLYNGSVLPENVIYQAEFKQGSGVYAFLDDTYFCYE